MSSSCADALKQTAKSIKRVITFAFIMRGSFFSRLVFSVSFSVLLAFLKGAFQLYVMQSYGVLCNMQKGNAYFVGEISSFGKKELSLRGNDHRHTVSAAAASGAP